MREIEYTSLFIPQHGQLIRELRQRQSAWLLADQDRLDDIRRKKRKPKQTGSEGRIQANLARKV
jgi:hypothetical protein